MCLMYSSSFFQTWSCHHCHTRKQPGRLPCSSSPKKHKTLSSIPRAPRGTCLGHHLCRSSSFCSVGEYLSVCPLETSLPLVCLKSAPISYESCIWSGIILWILRVWCLKVVSIATWSIRQHPQRKMGKETEIACRWIESSEQQSNNCCAACQRHKHICRQTMFFLRFVWFLVSLSHRSLCGFFFGGVFQHHKETDEPYKSLWLFLGVAFFQHHQEAERGRRYANSAGCRFTRKQSEDDARYRENLQGAMESWCRWHQQSLNDRQDRWEQEIASDRQNAKDELAAQADALGIECEDWGIEIDEIENIANHYQKAAWFNQDSFF